MQILPNDILAKVVSQCKFYQTIFTFRKTSFTQRYLHFGKYIPQKPNQTGLLSEREGMYLVVKASEVKNTHGVQTAAIEIFADQAIP